MTKPKSLILASTVLLVVLLAVAQPLFAAMIASETKLTASDAAAGDVFGRVTNSQGISGNTVVVGAYLDDNPIDDEGSAYVFVKNGSAWDEQAKLAASDKAPNDLFGQAVSIDGDTVVIGSFFDDDFGSHSGSAYVFRRDSAIWSEEAKLLPSDGAEADMFGISVSLSADVTVIGSPFDDDLGADSGSAYVFRWDGNAWIQEAKLTAGDGAAGDQFGREVAIRGNVIVVGAPFWEAGPPSRDSGAAYVFRWDGSAWSQEAQLIADDAARLDRFGFSVSIDGDTVVSGAYLDGRKDTGSAYVFRWDGSVWSQEAKLTASDASNGDLFGFSVFIDGEMVVVGAPLGDDGVITTGAAYLFQRTGTVWSEELKINASDGADQDFFGESVSIDGNFAVVGAPRDDDAGDLSGSAYVYELTP